MEEKEGGEEGRWEVSGVSGAIHSSPREVVFIRLSRGTQKLVNCSFVFFDVSFNFVIVCVIVALFLFCFTRHLCYSLYILYFLSSMYGVSFFFFLSLFFSFSHVALIFPQYIFPFLFPPILFPFIYSISILFP